MKLQFFKIHILPLSLVYIFLMPSFTHAQNSKFGIQLGLNSVSTVKNVNDGSTAQIAIGISLIQKVEDIFLINTTLNFISPIDRFGVNYLNYDGKVGYAFELYNYGIIPKVGIYGSNPISSLDFDFGSAFELEFNKKFKQIEFFSVMNYKQSFKKEKYSLSSEEIHTKNYALNIQFGLYFVFIKI